LLAPLFRQIAATALAFDIVDMNPFTSRDILSSQPDTLTVFHDSRSACNWDERNLVTEWHRFRGLQTALAGVDRFARFNVIYNRGDIVCVMQNDCLSDHC